MAAVSYTHLDVYKRQIKIQEGCNRYCTYCIIPYARGPIRSRKPEEVVEEVKKLAENGFKEVVLTGIHVASYGPVSYTHLRYVTEKFGRCLLSKW